MSHYEPLKFSLEEQKHFPSWDMSSDSRDNDNNRDSMAIQGFGEQLRLQADPVGG